MYRAAQQPGHGGTAGGEGDTAGHRNVRELYGRVQGVTPGPCMVWAPPTLQDGLPPPAPPPQALHRGGDPLNRRHHLLRPAKVPNKVGLISHPLQYLKEEESFIVLLSSGHHLCPHHGGRACQVRRLPADPSRDRFLDFLETTVLQQLVAKEKAKWQNYCLGTLGTGVCCFMP